MSTDGDRPYDRNLFVEYRASGDPAARDALAAEHIRLAAHLARRFVGRGVPLEDLEQVAAVGLLKAIDRFEPERGLEFSTFATPTILGELKRHFRDRGWSIRVPRRVQDLTVRLNVLVADLTHQLGRSPTVAELASASRSSEEAVLEAMEAGQAYQPGSIDPAIADPSIGTGDDDPSLLAAENRLLVEELLSHLGPRERLLVRLRFFEEMTQSQIAERLGISQMHVSRLLTRSLAELRSRFDARVPPDGP